jgi:hypothetical protein
MAEGTVKPAWLNLSIISYIWFWIRRCRQALPANLPPQSRAAERRYTDAKTLPEKIKYLQEFISTIPEHKGNEKMRGYLRRRLAQLKDELDDQKRRKAGSSGGGGFSVKKEGAAQIVILGSTGSGKSALLERITNAKSQTGDHSFVTQEPVPGMMHFEDIQFQLVDTPAIFKNVRGGAWGSQLLSLARNADGLLILLEAPAAKEQYEMIIEEIASGGITIDRKVRKIDIEKTTGGGIQIACTGRISCRVEDVDKVLKENGIRNAIVRIWGDLRLEDIEEAMDQTKTFKPALVVINKTDLKPGAPAEFSKSYGRQSVGISVATGQGLKELGRYIFCALGIIRVYTKDLGGEVAKKPIIVKDGAKVLDIAKIVHSSLYKNFKYAKILGRSVKYNGERVGAEHVLADGDIVEIRIK